MTVSELIAKLQEYPSDMLVMVNGYEGGYDDVKESLMSTQTVCLNYSDYDEVYNEDYYGQHFPEWYLDDIVVPAENMIEVLILGRSSSF